MPSFNCNDMTFLKRQRVRAVTNDERITIENSTEQSTTVNTLSKTRRSTLIGLPATLIGSSTPDLRQSFRTQLTVFFYNEERFQEICYRSIDDIREIKDNECLWIDVTGVNMIEFCSVF